MKLRLYALAAVFGLALVPTPAPAAPMAKTGLAGTTHDIGGIGCKSCHAPHSGALANGGPQSTGLIMLWSRSFPAAANTFGVYDSATMGNKAVEVGGSALTTSSDTRMYSLLCLSCHDGVTSTFTTAMKQTNVVGYKSTFGGTTYTDSLGLTNDHPIAIPYNPTASVNDALQPLATVQAAGLPLYGSTNTLQCATCHDSHNNTNTNYLRQANNTTHCTSCHM